MTPLNSLPGAGNSYYPNKIYTKLYPGLTFVFGSNARGAHGRGAALTAKQHFGAMQGVGFGFTGNCYAIPTKDNLIITRPIESIYTDIAKFVEQTRDGDKHYFVTEVACGLAGFNPHEIAPMFAGSQNCWFPESWKPYLTSNPADYPDTAISGFFDEHRWLSNFYSAKVTLGGQVFPSVENGYQAAKTTNAEDRLPFTTCSALHSKRYGTALALREGWDDIKPNVMLFFLRQKFSQEFFKNKLLATGDSLLIEENTWGDVYFGVCRGKGRNMLGKLLMQIRGELKCN